MTETTDPQPDPLDTHGMTMDGEPAMPILVAEYNALVSRVNEAERIRENADFHLGQEMARRQLAEKETARLRAVVARMRQMTDHWEKQLPELIRTPAVASAIRAALEAADGPSRMADEAPQPETQARRCAHNDIAWGLCTLPSGHDGDCLHEHQSRCGAWGGCTLRRGHNIGQADIPENHQPPPAAVSQPGKEA